MQPLRVLICPPQAIVRSGVATTLRAGYRASDVSVTMACTRDELETTAPDTHLRSSSGIWATTVACLRRSPALRSWRWWRLRKTGSDGAAILSGFRQGARGIVSLTNDLSGLPEACYRASVRQPYLSDSLLDPLLSHLSRPSSSRAVREFGLTPRECEVLAHLAHGLTHREIAAKLRTTERTVRHHLEQIYRKLRVQNRLQAVTHAYRQGLAF